MINSIYTLIFYCQTWNDMHHQNIIMRKETAFEQCRNHDRYIYIHLAYMYGIYEVGPISYSMNFVPISSTAGIQAMERKQDVTPSPTSGGTQIWLPWL